MAGKRPPAQLADARNAFRNKRPLDALTKVRALSEQVPDDADVAQFQAAVLAHIDARMRQSLRARNHDAVIEWARPLVFEPDYAESAQSALIEALRQTSTEAERASALLALSREGPLVVDVWREIGTLIDHMPSGAQIIAVGFRILRHLPGNRTVLEAIAQHLSRLGFHDAPHPDDIKRLVQAIRARIDGNDPEIHPLHRRMEIYAALRAGMEVSDPIAEGALDGVKPFLALEHAIAEVEDSFRPAGANRAPSSETVWNYADPGAAEFVLTTPPELSAEARMLLRQDQIPVLGWSPLWRMRVILSLWLRSVNYEASQDRIGYLWLVLDPLIHVLIICAFPLLIYADYVADMETFPFAVIGACLWLSCRMAATGSLAGGGVLKSQLSHPSLRPLDVLIARAISAPVSYFFVGSALLMIAAYLGLVPFPMNLPLFLTFFLTIWVIGLSYGIIVYSLIRRYPGFRRINGFLLRLFALTSGLFYVTEQMPDVLADIVLWNPTVHIMQLARSAWFFNYQTTDASLVYVIGTAFGLAALALAFLAVDERHIAAVRA